jgi:hypothetical protein
MNIAALLLFLTTFSADDSSLIGRWDVTAKDKDGEYPSWLEVRKSGRETLVGSYVARFGSARPVSEVKVEGNKFWFTVPKQWERHQGDITVNGVLEDGKLVGATTSHSGDAVLFTGVRAPSLKREKTPTWGEAVEIFNGKDVVGWKARSKDAKHGWVVKDGLLFNEKPGVDLMTEKTFDDFKLHAEFRYPKGSNSGIYLRGRYELQIEDNFGKEADSHFIGGVYGFLTPSVNAGKKAGEWQTIDVELVGRVVTVTLNGERVIDRQTIPGPTGGAIDSEEGKPGPILLQGDHGPAEFRKISVQSGASGG